jgi:hypothetical protein
MASTAMVLIKTAMTAMVLMLMANTSQEAPLTAMVVIEMA